MLPHKHAIISATIGATAWVVSGDSVVLATALAAGVLPDVDHVLDYAYLRWRGGHRLILLLHGYEYVFLGAAMAFTSGNAIAAIATLSYLVHLLADQLENQTRWPGYLLLFRIWHQFRIEAISTAPEAAMRGRDDDVRRLQEWWLRRFRRSERA